MFKLMEKLANFTENSYNIYILMKTLELSR